MNVETFAFIVLGMIVDLSLILCVNFIVKNFLKWSGANRRASELLRAVLSVDQHHQLMQLGYVDIPSPRDQEHIYRVPRGPGLVRVIEKERPTMSLCLKPLEKVPDADIVVLHKLLIEADEVTYLQTANRFAPRCISYRDD